MGHSSVDKQALPHHESGGCIHALSKLLEYSKEPHGKLKLRASAKSLLCIASALNKAAAKTVSEVHFRPLPQTDVFPKKGEKEWVRNMNSPKFLTCEQPDNHF